METDLEDTEVHRSSLSPALWLMPSQVACMWSVRATDLICKGKHLYLVLLSLRRCREEGEAGLVQASPPSGWVRALAPPWTWTNIFGLYNPESLQSHVFILGQRVKQTADKQNQTQWLCNSVFGLLQTGIEVPWRQKSLFTSSNQSALGTPCMPAELKEGMKTSLSVALSKKQNKGLYEQAQSVFESTRWKNSIWLFMLRRGTKCSEWERLQSWDHFHSTI